MAVNAVASEVGREVILRKIKFEGKLKVSAWSL